MTNGTQPEDEYITVEAASKRLRVSPRQVQRHAANGRVESRHEGRRLLLLRADVERLAQELGADSRPEAPHEGEIVAETSPLLDYMRELNGQLLVMTRRVGELEGMLQHRLLPADEALLRQELTEAQAKLRENEERIKALEEENKRLQRPWWRRLLG